MKNQILFVQLSLLLILILITIFGKLEKFYEYILLIICVRDSEKHKFVMVAGLSEIRIL
jgi:hypothetical protein